MKPHITDHKRDDSPRRAARYFDLERSTLPSKATLALQARNAEQAPDSRVANYLRIARGHSA